MMSIVKYKNKKTGAIAIYESTSRYDPVTRQSRPIRKYLGMEDPETGELIPSSGQRGRKRKKGEAPANSAKNEHVDEKNSYELLYAALKKECAEKDLVIKKLKMQNKALTVCLQRIQELINTAPGKTDDNL